MTLLARLRAPALVFAAGAITGTSFASTAAIASNTLSSNPCEQTASAIREAARLDANAEFWISVASCINHPNELQLCLREAWGTRHDELELIELQHQARLAACSLLGGAAYDPDLDEDDFAPNVTNAFFPLVPGRTLVYQAQTSDGLERVEVTTLAATIDIDDIPCRQVRDRVTLDGEVVEDTIDWYSQNANGTVWYVGEIAQNFEDGLLDNLDGSWRAGKDGAEPGIQMLATPMPGTAYRQEFLPNEAEDIARVLSTGETVVVPAGTFANCVRIEEWTPLSPGPTEWKYYAPGIGLVLEVDPDSGQRLELVQIVN